MIYGQQVFLSLKMRTAHACPHASTKMVMDFACFLPKTLTSDFAYFLQEKQKTDFGYYVVKMMIMNEHSHPIQGFALVEEIKISLVFLQK